MLWWAREHGCLWRAENICALAAEGGHLAVLRWAREYDCLWWRWWRSRCPWDVRTCGGAAAGGHLVVLTRLLGRGLWGRVFYDGLLCTDLN